MPSSRSMLPGETKSRAPRSRKQERRPVLGAHTEKVAPKQATNDASDPCAARQPPWKIASADSTPPDETEGRRLCDPPAEVGASERKPPVIAGPRTLRTWKQLEKIDWCGAPYTQQRLSAVLGEEAGQLLWPCLLHASWQRDREPPTPSHAGSRLFSLEVQTPSGHKETLLAIAGADTSEERLAKNIATRLVSGALNLHLRRLDEIYNLPSDSEACSRVVEQLLAPNCSQDAREAPAEQRRQQCVAAAEWNGVKISVEGLRAIIDVLSSVELRILLQHLETWPSELRTRLQWLERDTEKKAVTEWFSSQFPRSTPVPKTLCAEITGFSRMDGHLGGNVREISLTLLSGDSIDLPIEPGERIEQTRVALTAHLRRQRQDAPEEPESPTIAIHLGGRLVPDGLVFPEDLEGQDYYELFCHKERQDAPLEAVLDTLASTVLRSHDVMRIALSLARAAELAAIARTSVIVDLSDRIRVALKEIPISPPGELLVLLGGDA